MKRTSLGAYDASKSNVPGRESPTTFCAALLFVLFECLLKLLAAHREDSAVM